MLSPWLVMQWIVVFILAAVALLIVFAGTVSAVQLWREKMREPDSPPIIVQHPDGQTEEFTGWREFWESEGQHWDVNVWQLGTLETEEEEEENPWG